jgi:hypothetical protein
MACKGAAMYFVQKDEKEKFEVIVRKKWKLAKIIK